MTCGNAYDALKKTAKSIKIYDEGIKAFPDYYQLHFNKGITLAGMEKYDEAIPNFHKAVSLNPDHASSHNALARLLNINNKRIPSVLAYARFLVIEPQSKRANENLLALQKLMNGNAEKTGTNAVTINISTDMLSGAKPKENDFAPADLFLAMSAGLDFDKENSNKTEIEKFIRKFKDLSGILEETRKDNYGFYWAFYVPYFVEMKDKGLVETFAYIAFATSDDPVVAAWLTSHKSEIDKFYDWSGSFSWQGK